jgi:hypothetical protein
MATRGAVEPITFDGVFDGFPHDAESAAANFAILSGAKVNYTGATGFTPLVVDRFSDRQTAVDELSLGKHVFPTLLEYRAMLRFI